MNKAVRKLGDIAKVRGMAQLAKDTGLSRESLYKTPLASACPLPTPYSR